MTITVGISIEWIGSSRIILSIIRLYFYACISLFIGFVLPLLFEPLELISSSILNVLVATELSFGLNAPAYGIVIATLFTFTWNFLLGAGLQIISGLFGPASIGVSVFTEVTISTMVSVEILPDSSNASMS